jgi:phage repressor protein C with HTH and peptisase S24 domain
MRNQNSSIRRGHYIALTVKGDHLQPDFHADDVVLVRTDAPITVDSMVVLHGPNGYTMKRVGSVSRATIQLLSFNVSFPPMCVARSAVARTIVLQRCGHRAAAAEQGAL